MTTVKANSMTVLMPNTSQVTGAFSYTGVHTVSLGDALSSQTHPLTLSGLVQVHAHRPYLKRLCTVRQVRQL